MKAIISKNVSEKDAENLREGIFVLFFNSKEIPKKEEFSAVREGFKCWFDLEVKPTHLRVGMDTPSQAYHWVELNFTKKIIRVGHDGPRASKAEDLFMVLPEEVFKNIPGDWELEEYETHMPEWAMYMSLVDKKFGTGPTNLYEEGRTEEEEKEKNLLVAVEVFPILDRSKIERLIKNFHMPLSIGSEKILSWNRIGFFFEEAWVGEIFSGEPWRPPEIDKFAYRRASAMSIDISIISRQAQKRLEWEKKNKK